MDRRALQRPKTLAAVVPLVLLLSAGTVVTILVVQTGHGSSPVDAPTSWVTGKEARALEATYAPTFHFSQEEMLFPVGVEYFIDRSVLRMVGGVLIDPRPTIGTLGQVNDSGYFLDDLDGGAGDTQIIDRYVTDRPGLDVTIYSHVVQTRERVLLQYWAFYVFDRGGYNSHEGDWEMAQVDLDGPSRQPLSLTTSVHHSVAHTSWSRVVKEGVNGTSPAIFVAQGSHANYAVLDGGYSLGDTVDGLGQVYGPQNYKVIDIGHGSDQSTYPPWLLFPGRWGEQGGSLDELLGRNGPPGPLFRESGTLWNGNN